MSEITEPIVLDESFVNSFKEVNDNLHKIALGVGGDYAKPSKWEDIQILCRNGRVKSVLEIGDIYNVNKDGVEYPFAVMGFIEENKTGSIKIKNDNLLTGVIFQSVDCVYEQQFDEREAFYSNSEAMSAGTYNFVLGAHSWYSSDVGKTFQFTLANDLPAGGQFVFAQNYNASLVNASVRVFTDGASTTVRETVTLTEGSGGTSLGTLNNGINGNLNSCQRAIFGNNAWKYSAMRQQLNSDAIAGGVWLPQTKWDRPPNWATTRKGFLNGLDADLLKCIVPVEIDTYRNTVCDGGGLETTEDRIFLAGRNECYLTQEGADNGVAWDYYKEGCESATPVDSAKAIRIKKINGTPKYWWLRTPIVGHAGIVRCCSASGGSGSDGASSSYGVAPAFVIA